MGWILLGNLSGLHTLFVAHVYLDTWLHLTGSSANGGSPKKLQVRDESGCSQSPEHDYKIEVM
mgnify:FL=1